MKQNNLFSMIIVVLCIVVPVFFIIRNTIDNNSSIHVKMYVYNDLAYDILLPTYGNYVLNHGTNVVQINGYDVTMIESDCNNGLCLKTGKINRSGQSIVCLPNHVSVYISSSDIII